MKERPILFSGPMVRAILEGRKTQTRRVVDSRYEITGPNPPNASTFDVSDGEWNENARIATVSSWVGAFGLDGRGNFTDKCPYGKPGDRLWVRETFYSWRCKVYTSAGMTEGPDQAVYAADGGLLLNGAKWKPSIHMPRWASRITLEITDVRVERLQEISEADAKAEGCDPWQFGPEQTMTSGERGAVSPYRGGYACLWDEINADRATWKSNPWVWAITFKVVQP
jgi:hypothetical protein